MPAASAASGRGLAEPPPARLARWRLGARPEAGRGAGWGDLPRRFASAAVLVPPALFCAWAGGPAWAVLIAALAAGAGVEWASLAGFRPFALPGLAVPVLVAATALAGVLGRYGAGLGALAVGLALAFVLPRTGRARPLWLGLGVPYIGAAGLALVWLRARPAAGLADLAFVLLVVWASDTGAFFAGRACGGPRLAPRLSPAKTWSGAAGGLLAAVLAGEAVAALAGPAASWAGVRGALAAALLLGLAAQAGDLLESALKRRFGVKDTGRIIPGHGGLLDRVDALLLAAPAAAALAWIAGPAVPLWR